MVTTTNSINGVIVNQATGAATLRNGSTYITNNGASLVTYTLPAAAAIGDVYRVIGQSSGLWKIAVGTGQLINFGNMACTTSTGYLQALAANDCITLTCVTANTTFVAYGGAGNIQIV